MKAVTFLIKLDEPLLATQIENGEANSSISSSFIPGSMIRGALIGQYLANPKLTKSEKDKLFRPLFFDGRVQYLNAYLARPTDYSRALPKPLSWFSKKEEASDKEEARDKEEASDSEATIFDFACKRQTDKSYKAVKSGDFVWQTSDSVQLVSPHRIGVVHNTSKNPNRKDKNNSQVYRYEALASGQCFAGAIVIKDEIVSDDEDGKLNLIVKIKDLLALGNLKMGGSQTAGYGRISICEIQVEDDWQEFMPLPVQSDRNQDYEDDEQEMPQPQPQIAVLTCLSDLIWRDKQGQHNADLTLSSGQKPVNAFYRLHPTGGFNRQWGLPLCQTWAIQAGSVFVFPADCYTELTQWVSDGVGERRNEGFGRVALNWHINPKLNQSPHPLFTPEYTDVALSVESRQLAQDMANRQLQVIVEQQLLKRIDELNSFQRLPKTAHLSRARLAAQRAWHKKDLVEIHNYFDGLSPTAVKQWERARIKNQIFKNWIIDQINKVNEFNLGNEVEIPAVAGVEANFSSIRIETLARLIEGVLRQAIKQAKARDEGGQNGTMA